LFRSRHRLLGLHEVARNLTFEIASAANAA
jgi:hypothetical protein